MMVRIKEVRKEERKFNVLGHVVHSYVSTPVPVSSSLIARRMGGNLSSATVRNILAALEEEGYIKQPHTSAGRVPTQYGYRRYVDMAQEHIRLKKEEAERLKKEYVSRISTLREVIEKTSFLISSELHHAGIVMWPEMGDFYVKHIELVKLNAETIMAVLVTMTNAVQNHIISLDRELEKGELERIANYINTNYERSGLMNISSDLKRTLNDSPEYIGPDIIDLASSALQVIDSLIDAGVTNELSWEGLNYLVDEPESGDNHITRGLLGLFSDRKELVRLMRDELPDNGLKVYIGRENKSDKLKDCSLITAGYTLHGRTVGRLGVVGPTRMDYDRALQTMNCLAGLISAKIEEING